LINSLTPLHVAALSSGATLVTASARLARNLTLTYDRLQASSGLVLWEAADVLSWDSWLKRCWHLSATTAGAPMLLSPAQEEIVWERIIGSSEEAGSLLNLSGAAAEASRAYALLNAWGLPLADPSFAWQEDTAAFQRWAREFERQQRINNWVSAALLERSIGDSLNQKSIVAPVRLLYAGFFDPAPAQKALLEALAAAGCTTEVVPFPASPESAVTRTGLPDSAAEIAAAANWARGRLEAVPDVRIGVVVQDLTKLRTIAERIFDDVLHPSLEFAGQRPRAFHISAPPALTESPVIAAAFGILSLGGDFVGVSEAGALLRSPFVAGFHAEMCARALLDAEIRRRGLFRITLTRLAREAAGAVAGGVAPAWRSPELASRLTVMRRLLDGLRPRQGASGWSRTFSSLLRAAGWPGERTLDSTEYQSIERWNGLLSEFAALEAVVDPMDYQTALDRLRHMASQTGFAPADEGAPVQIMGVLEALGSAFDHLWVAGMDDRAWPPAPAPNPFLPLALQRKHNLPHSSAERALGQARMAMSCLLNSAPDVVVSFPQRDDDADLRPSPLIAGLAEEVLPAVRRGAVWRSGTGGECLERIEDGRAPALPPGTLQRGGMGVIQKQAACPFRAFAELRLDASQLEEPLVGFSAQERGMLVHAALELVWRELKKHSALVDTSVDIDGVVRRSVQEAIAKHVRGRGVEELPRLQALERRRLERLLRDWLEIERQRQPFEVLQIENKRRVRIGGIDIDIKVDRVDSLPDGRQVIIDYKTGRAKPSAWEGERPDEPQLPLYAATHDAPLAAVAFAHVAAGECSFAGLGEKPGIPTCMEYRESKAGKAEGDTLADHISDWRGVVERLAAEFAAGEATVAPKKSEICLYCPVPALCRVSEIVPPMEEAAETEDSDG
jgi:probable DNA repair protein